MINPPPERVEPTVCLIKPKGIDRAGHTARERGRERQIRAEEEKPPLLISPPLRLPSVYRTWQLVLTPCPFSSPPALLSPSTFIFLPWWKNVLLASLFSPLCFFLLFWPLFVWTKAQITEGCSLLLISRSPVFFPVCCRILHHTLEWHIFYLNLL